MGNDKLQQEDFDNPSLAPKGYSALNKELGNGSWPRMAIYRVLCYWDEVKPGEALPVEELDARIDYDVSDLPFNDMNREGIINLYCTPRINGELEDLCGYEGVIEGDERQLYAIDWAPVGRQLKSGLKEKYLKLWGFYRPLGRASLCDIYESVGISLSGENPHWPVSLTSPAGPTGEGWLPEPSLFRNGTVDKLDDLSDTLYDEIEISVGQFGLGPIYGEVLNDYQYKVELGHRIFGFYLTTNWHDRVKGGNVHFTEIFSKHAHEEPEEDPDNGIYVEMSADWIKENRIQSSVDTANPDNNDFLNNITYMLSDQDFPYNLTLMYKSPPERETQVIPEKDPEVVMLSGVLTNNNKYLLVTELPEVIQFFERIAENEADTADRLRAPEFVRKAP